ncbi:Pyrroline-5-carboxylate reductase [Pirellulimonas nuda]|uniref:Pyrroline-5-carboxylate reductase n=1 Tax=Pirellulimonas nuda TaxID=2528009 RepID=A0A518D9K8_9BACT|nr:pyrroline-5-carboxylate reductase [Pirellulimonas nuda]QDU88170.1 Pyrroline-5-carboxylate reductase [Pirellulimonas nuda]
MASGKLAFIGAGQMATALAGGMVRSKQADARQIWASDPDPKARERFESAIPGANAVAETAQAVIDAETVVLAVKPQYAGEALADAAPAIDALTLVVSIAAGVKIGSIAAALPDGARVVRVMPNTPCLIGQGASAYCLGPHATSEDGRRVAKILGAVGMAIELPERLLDAVTGLSGSGPAYVYTVIEALTDGGVLVGLPRDAALRLAAHTVAGAAAMVIETGQHPAQLRDVVTSPGGTTIAGLAELERGGLRSTLIDTVAAATDRSQELGR